MANSLELDGGVSDLVVSCDTSVGVVTGLRAGRPRIRLSIPRFYLFYTTFRPAFRATQPPISVKNSVSEKSKASGA